MSTADFTYKQYEIGCYNPLCQKNIDDALKQYLNENNLKLSETEDVKTFHTRRSPRFQHTYVICFFAREKTHDDYLGEQLEFMISNLT